MIILASRSATVLVIFTVAVLAFCFATVFASMTGPLNLFNYTGESVLDNLSAITDNNNSGYDSGSSQGYYSEDYSSSDNVESYTEPAQDSGQHQESSQDSQDEPTPEPHDVNGTGS